MRTDELVEALMSDDGYAKGDRRFPHPVGEDDAVHIHELVCEQVEIGTARREKSAALDGIRIACGRGCNRCCAEPLLVFEHEAIAIARWLELPEQTAVREAFLAAYPRWRAAMGDAPERLAELAAGDDQKVYDAAHVAQTRKGVLCAFNGADGACSIHPIRPVACRNGHAVDTPDYCGADHPSGKPATRLAYQPLDDFLGLVRRLERALHHALGGPRGRPESVCIAVHRLLAR